MKLISTLSRSRSQEDHWIPLSDLMTGLMMVFMLVAIMFMLQLQVRENKIKDMGQKYSDLRAQLCQDLRSKLKDDLANWKWDPSCSLSLRFLDPDAQFDTGSAVLKPKFRTTLDDFVPRYVEILRSEKYRDVIEEVRIEGHTSSLWQGRRDESAYYKNMELSQNRSRAVLEYAFKIPSIRDYLYWLVPLVTANGLSSSKSILGDDGNEDTARSQRVEFKVRTKAETRLEEILKTLSQ
jgi:outer membrane protein OmpA-like peptidoglycan-associated protein